MSAFLRNIPFQQNLRGLKSRDTRDDRAEQPAG